MGAGAGNGPQEQRQAYKSYGGQCHGAGLHAQRFRYALLAPRGLMPAGMPAIIAAGASTTIVGAA